MKLLEILFWSKLTLGSEVLNANDIVGLNRQIIKKNKPKKNFNNNYKQIHKIIIVNYFLYFQLKRIIHKSKINFNLLKINSIAISSAIIVRGLFDYSYVRFIDDIAIFSLLDKWNTFRFLNSSFFCMSCDFPI